MENDWMFITRMPSSAKPRSTSMDVTRPPASTCTAVRPGSGVLDGDVMVSREAILTTRETQGDPMRKVDLTNFRVATSETARKINRQIMLNLLRRHQPMSRADLARRSGLQRSTVSAIVDQLIDEGWITEGAIGKLPRGRRPRFLHLNAERAGIIGVDLRPETTTIGLAGLDARFVSQTAWPTPRDPDRFVEQLSRSIAELRVAHPRIACEG